MIVVSDTSPLTALLTVGQADLLPKLFTEVAIPGAVEMELLRCHSPLPAWLRVLRVKDAAKVKNYSQLVDAGEAEAIALAEEIKADRLLMDERKGRRLAREHGLAVVGLLGVVLLAKQSRLIPSARALLDRLDHEAGVYLGDNLKTDALKSVGE
jgi:predicted nucleic acid-binding protein